MHTDKSKYPESHTGGEKKGSVTDAGYNEENERQPTHTDKAPAPHSNDDKPALTPDRGSEHDDTGGGNNTGERSDDL